MDCGSGVALLEDDVVEISDSLVGRERVAGDVLQLKEGGNETDRVQGGLT